MNKASLQDYSIVVAAHGSRDSAGVREFEALVELMKTRAPGRDIAHGYLEFASPTIDEAVRAAVAAGTRRVVMLPALLFAATHAKNDMPSELAVLKRDFPAIEFHFGAAMDLHPLLLRLSQQRIVEAEALSGRTVQRVETCLVVVGRGTSDPDANSEVSKLARMLEEGLGFGSVFVCYSGTAKPSVADGLQAAARLGFQRMVVFPYFLFDGVLVKRIYAAADVLQMRHPEIEVLKAGYLGVHADVADGFLERAQEAVEGRAHMNCSLCKYRVQIVGFEEQVGAPQQAHHLRVRGLLARVAPPVVVEPEYQPYLPHPIEAESFRIIEAGRDWSACSAAEKRVLQRLVHTSGDFDIVDDMYFSPGAVATGIRALLRCQRVVTDVTMVQSGLRRSLLEQLGIQTWCGVYDRESHLLAQANDMTRSAAGIQRAWQTWGNDVIVAIGDAPTAIAETTRLIREHGWRPQLVIGLPVGFVGTRESKEDLRRCMQVPRITNAGTRGGSPWAAAVVNALMIAAVDHLAGVLEL
ncbi:MAG: precorrin-8X methylmutase [Gammaproteobacteria bacterium]